MRLKCEVDAVLRPEPGCTVRRSGRPSQTILTVGKEGREGADARINMLVSTSKSRQGTKYLLSGNVLKLYTRFVSEGKATISLINPAYDICISKADPLQLKSTLAVLRLVAEGQDVGGQVSVGSMRPPSTAGMRALQTSMVVKNRKEYPLTSSFPTALTSLTVNGCGMKRLDPRISSLVQLVSLNLAHNQLTALATSPGQWSGLSQLDLSSNQLAALPAPLYQSSLKDSLSILKVNSNQLQQLPLQVCEMRALVQLHADHNRITHLPPTIGRLCRLQLLSVQHNQIEQLPASMKQLRLQTLELFGNPIQQLSASTVLSSSLGVPSLIEVCARYIRKQRIPYSAEDLFPDLITYLDNARRCWCGGYCFQSCARYLRLCELSELSADVRAWDQSGRTAVPLEAFLCSPSCLSKFQNNPLAYWR